MVFQLVSIDPGKNLGIVHMEFRIYSSFIEELLLKENHTIIENHMEFLKEFLFRLVGKNLIVVLEDVYFFGKKPNAYSSLLYQIFHIEMFLKSSSYLYKNFFYVKKPVLEARSILRRQLKKDQFSFNQNKEDFHEMIKPLLPKKIFESLKTEHERDAFLLGYSFYLEIGGIPI